MADKIRIELEYTSEEDPELGSIQTSVVPRPGDLVRTPKGVYQVEKIFFDNINIQMGCILYAILSPSQYQIPADHPDTEQ